MLASRVLPGAALVRATRCRTSALIRLDLPTFERPTSPISARPSRGRSLALAALRTKLASMFKGWMRRTGRRGWKNRGRECVPACPAFLPLLPGASVSNGVVDDVDRLGLGLGGQTAAHHGFGQRDLQDFVHRL